MSTGEELVVVHAAGEFIGDVHTLSGRRSIVRARARTDGTGSSCPRENLLTLVQTDSELSGILHARLHPAARRPHGRGRGDVVLVGSSHSTGTLRLRSSSHATVIPTPTSISIAIRTRSTWSIGFT